MANINANNGITNSWSLLAFAKSHGKPYLTNKATHVDSEGNAFESRSLAFEHPTEKETLADGTQRAKLCFVGFSQKLGELSAKEIMDRQDDLQVVEYASKTTGEPRYALCERGNGWEQVQLAM